MQSAGLRPQKTNCLTFSFPVCGQLGLDMLVCDPNYLAEPQGYQVRGSKEGSRELVSIGGHNGGVKDVLWDCPAP